MTVSELSKNNSLTALCMPDGDRVIKGAYIGDLLSWVMGRAKADNAWITIMSNSNTVAVASLADVSCVILAEGVTLEDSVIETAKQNNINILSTNLTAYEAAVMLSKLEEI
ncbi:MAG: hypothetical protein E7526_00080 [Ruminococcaceae bacterium]|nr:hypothetical protein [Oscillospiraceae bacterium]